MLAPRGRVGSGAGGGSRSVELVGISGLAVAVFCLSDARENGKWFVELARLLIVPFRVGLGQLFQGPLFVGLPQFFVRALVTGGNFVGLARFFFCFALGLHNFCVGVVLSEPPVGLSQFLVWAVSVRESRCFLELART